MNLLPKPLLAAALVCTVLPAFASEQQARLQVELLPRAEVDASPVRLGDLARVLGDDPRQVHAAAALSLGAGPRVGEVLTLERRQIERWVQRLDGQVGVIEWSGASAVRIERTSQSVPAEDVCRVAHDLLADWLNRFGGTTTVTPVCGTAAWAVPPGRVELKPHAMAEGQRPERRMQVAVDIWTDGAFARSVAVTLRVEVTGRAWVARRDVRAQQRLGRDALELRDADLVGLTAAALSADAIVEDMRLRRPLMAGQVLTSAHVEARPLVARGQRVHLQSRSGAITLETQAEALQDGELGQQVLVRVPTAVEPVAALVIGLNEVELKP